MHLTINDTYSIKNFRFLAYPLSWTVDDAVGKRKKQYWGNATLFKCENNWEKYLAKTYYLLHSPTYFNSLNNIIDF